jgi:hypothetical protein
VGVASGARAVKGGRTHGSRISMMLSRCSATIWHSGWAIPRRPASGRPGAKQIRPHGPGGAAHVTRHRGATPPYLSGIIDPACILPARAKREPQRSRGHRAGPESPHGMESGPARDHAVRSGSSTTPVGSGCSELALPHVAARNRREWNFAATDFLEARRQTPSPSGRLGRWLARFTESGKQLYGAECRVPTRPVLAAAAS